jgi:hypothetical protein
MGFIIENEENSIIKFVLKNPFNHEDLKKFLGILSSLLDIAEKDATKAFAFYVDTRDVTLSAELAKGLIFWMKKNRPRIKNNLIATAVIVRGTIIASLLSGVFKLQPPVSPNIITTNIDKAKLFINTKINETILSANTEMKSSSDNTEVKSSLINKFEEIQKISKEIKIESKLDRVQGTSSGKESYLDTKKI